jgi:hypothetical protein
VVVPPRDGEAEGAADASTTQPDAPVAIDAGPFCADVDAQFCWSFDSVSQALLGPRLSTQKTGAPPTVVATGLSAPNAMATSLSTPGNVGVNLDVGVDVSHLRCELDVIFDKADSDAGDRLAIAQLDYPGSSFYLPVLVARKTDPSTLRVALTFTGVPDVDLGNVPVGQWVHAYVDTDLFEGNWRVRAQMLANGEGTLDAGVRKALPRFDRVFFGLATFAPTFDWGVRYDNLVCYWQ